MGLSLPKEKTPLLPPKGFHFIQRKWPKDGSIQRKLNATLGRNQTPVLGRGSCDIPASLMIKNMAVYWLGIRIKGPKEYPYNKPQPRRSQEESWPVVGWTARGSSRPRANCHVIRNLELMTSRPPAGPN